MLDRQNIPFSHWSIKVGRVDPKTGSASEYFGEFVTALNDIHQSITSLVLTPIRSVPIEPEKGCDYFPYIDKHTSIAIPNITRAVWDALTMWEPRIVVQNVEVVQTERAHFAVKILWRPTQSVLDELLVTEVSLNPNNNNIQIGGGAGETNNVRYGSLNNEQVA